MDETNKSTIIKTIVVLIILSLLLIIYVSNKYNEIYLMNKYMFGSWESDIKFNKDADLKSLKVFVGEPKESINYFNIFNPMKTITRDCYFHMDGNNMDGSIKNIMSKILIMKYGLNDYKSKKDVYTLKVKYDFEEDDPIKNDLFLELDIINGYMKLYDTNDKLYAMLYKDNSSTHILNLEKESDSESDSE